MQRHEAGARVQVTWSGRIVTVVNFHEGRLAEYRVLLDGETTDWGFAVDELVTLPMGGETCRAHPAAPGA